MRQSDLLLASALVLATGCARQSERVSINLYAVPLPAPAESKTPPKPLAKGPGARSLTLPDMPARNVLVGSGQALAARAIAEAKRNQDEAFRQALRELRDAYAAEAAASSQEELGRSRRAFEANFKEAFAALRTVFDEHAAKAGPLWTRLAVLRGFPIKNVRFRPSPESVYFGRDEAKEVEQLTKQIASLDSVYRARVGERIEALKQDWRAIQTELEAKRIVAQDDAEQRAIKDARNLTTEILKEFEQSLIEDVERLPAIQGTTLKLGEARVSTVTFPDPGASVWSDADRLQRRAELFAETKGYRLVKPGFGVRDATKEFLDWDKVQTGR